MTDSVETYLHELVRIRSTGAGVPETSYYSALSNLLNEVGHHLSPPVVCVMQLANQGAGSPDGGLFTQDQLRKGVETAPGQLPARGAIEVKPTRDDAWLVSDSTQVSKYWNKYRLVLVTNYRDFLLLGEDSAGRPHKLEAFRLAENENAFWTAASTPRKTSKLIGERFADYLKRIMLHSAKLADPEDVAWFLASYAREAKARIETKNLPSLAGLREALEKSLGLKFEGQRGERFFISTLVQTLFYGVFSAWILWYKQNVRQSSSSRFDWRGTAWLLHVPMVKELFDQIATPTRLGELELVEVLNWTEAVLNRVSQKEFFKRFEEQHAVEYFYEPFLEQFDPVLRKELGVWYTPKEVVRYSVARIDKVLREELDVEDGFANPRVYVLDPGNGTGSYLVEVLHTIAETLKEKGADALIAADLKRAALTRILGFEILPAPFVVAHLQIGLLLQSYGVQLSPEGNDRAGVYLTNSLTGWDLPHGAQERLAFPELEKERNAADEVKRETPILVVLGNPPYNSFAGVSPKEEGGLVEPYKEGLISQWGIKKFNLDDLYVRFFRLAERRIAEQTGRGVICYITNFSFLGDPSFVVMRQRFLKEFDKMWFDNMNGSSRETGKLTPDGKPDPSVFSTKRNPEGIRVGTAISLLVRKSNSPTNPTVRYRNFWGVTKREDLVRSLEAPDIDKEYQSVAPSKETRFSFRASQVTESYLKWPLITELCRVNPFNGPVERRGYSLIKMEADRAKLDMIRDYLNAELSDDQIRVSLPQFMESSGEFSAEKARRTIIKRRVYFKPDRVVRYPVKPMDVRLAYLDADIQPLFSRPNPELINISQIPGNSFFITRDTADKRPEGSPFYLSSSICDYDFISGHARHIPTWVFPLAESGANRKLSGHANKQTALDTNKEIGGEVVANLSPAVVSYLRSLGLNAEDQSTAELVWLHALAIGYSRLYLRENADGIHDGWPRLPLPSLKQSLLQSAELGRGISNLLNMGRPVPRVTQDPLGTGFKSIGLITRVGGGQLDTSRGDLKITVGWGHGTEVVMPGVGRAVERDYSSGELEALDKEGALTGISQKKVLETMGDTTFDVYLNDSAYWKNVPAGVWDYVIGGYQVFKKWLSYRDYQVIGRSLTLEEVRQGTEITRRLAAILLMQPGLDVNYKDIKKQSFPLPESLRNLQT
jgi:Type ISP C-terminal specificity domain/N-6 DNA Methylase